MIIKYVITLNWGNLPNKQYDFRPGFNLIVGDAGSGKSTLLDGVQTVMSAAKHGLFNYNAGQGTEETRTKAKEYRSFASYLLGGDQGRFSRSACEGAVACIFEGDDGGIFTAWVYGVAVLEGSGGQKRAKERQMHLGILKNNALTLEDFLEGDLSASEQNMRDYKRFIEHLQSRYAATNVETFSDKGSYLSRLYGAFRGKSSATKAETQDAAKAFIRYIHPKEVSDVHRFVYDELLEKKDLSGVVQNLSEILQRSHRLKNEAEAYETAQRSLVTIARDGETVLQRWHELYRHRLEEAEQAEGLNRRDAEKIRHMIVEGQKRYDAAALSLEAVKTKRDETQSLISSLEQQASGHEELNRQKRLEEQRQAYASQLAKSIGRFGRTIHEIEDALSTLRLCGSFDKSGEIEAMQRRIGALMAAEEIRNVQHADEADLILLKGELAEACEAISAQLDLNNPDAVAYAISEQRLTNATLLKEKEAQRQSLMQEAQNIGNAGRIRYPGDVEKALGQIKSRFPEADVRVLCESVEIIDTSWQNAIEGYLRQNRFALIVEGEYEADATRLLRDSRLHGAKVLQGERLLNDLRVKGESLQERSIAHLMEFHDPIVRAFFILMYGSVVQVRDAETLARTARGLTRDGMGSGSYSTFACSIENHECVIGKKARSDRQEHIAQRLEQIKGECTPLSSSKGQLSGLLSHIQNAKVGFDASEIDEMVELRTKIARLDDELTAINVTEVADLTERIKTLQSGKQTHEQEIEQLSAHKGELESETKRMRGNLADALSRVEKAQRHTEEARQQFERAVSILGITQESAPTFEETINSFERDVLKVSYAWMTKISEHNLTTLASTQITYDDYEMRDTFESLSHAKALHATVTALLHTVEHGLLFEKKRLLDTSNSEFRTVFVESFCTKVYDHIQSGVHQLEAIGRTLRRNTFGEERFTISAVRNPEYAEYFRFFEQIVLQTEKGELLPGVADADTDIGGELYAMLLESGADEKAIKRLLAIADYRNYHRYDIKKILNNDTENAISLNKLATDSGGQAETSYYVIRSIAAYSAFGNDALKKEQRALRFLCIDEGFSKVDEYRPEKILDFLIKDLGFQIITAMPTKNERVFLPFTRIRHLVIKETINASHDNFQVKVLVPCQELNREAIGELQERDRAKITMQFA